MRRAMPVAYTVENGGSLLRIRVEDPMTVADIRAYFWASQADSTVRRHHARLFDIRGVRIFPSTSELAQLGRAIRESPSMPIGRVAVIVDSHMGEAVSRMIALFGEMTEMHAFRGERAAREWLSTGHSKASLPD